MLTPLVFVEKTFNGRAYGEAEFTHNWGYLTPTSYNVIATQSTEINLNGIVNPPCCTFATYNTDENTTKILAFNPDGSAYTGAVWIATLAIGN